MKTYNLFIVLISLLLFSLNTEAQQIQPKLPADKIVNTYYPVQAAPAAPTFINPFTYEDKENWSIVVSQRGGITHSNLDEDEVDRLKAEKLILKSNGSQDGSDSATNTRDNPPSNPVVVSGFRGNNQDGWVPPDNSMAISDSGYIVSVINSAISYYDEEGNTLLADRPFNGFLNGLGVTNFLFDPRVLYDPVSDRFILIVLAGSDPANSTIVAGFSVSQNPTDGWNFYTLRDDFLQGGWFDYPSIGISGPDLYVSGNLFGDAFGVTILQIQKEEGYNGEELVYEYYNDIDNANGGSAFTVVPASYGFDDEYGPGVFMVSGSFFSGGSINLFEVTDSVSNDQQLNVYSTSTPSYSVPGNVFQLGTDVLLDSGDSRVKEAHYADSIVHLVLTNDVGGGFAGVRYTRINVTDLTSESVDVGQANLDLTYPTMKPLTKDETDKTVLIGYLQSSAETLPGIGAVVVDDNMEISDPVVLKGGQTFIDGGEIQRWGDYSGSSVRHNADTATVWVFGTYGRIEDFGNWISEVSLSSNGEAPIINFEGNPTRGPVTHSVLFNDLSTNGATAWQWSFPEGSPSSSTERSPTVNYFTPGAYDVELIVSNDAGSDTLYRTEYIEAFILPTSDFEADITEGPAPLTVNFTQLSQFGESYIWFFTGGSPPVVNSPEPTITYNNPGTFNVTLTTTNPFGQAVELKPNYISVGPPVATEDVDQVVEDVQVFPNPASNFFKVDFFMKERIRLDVHIADVTGKVVKQIIHDSLRPGNNQISFNTDPLPSGTYFVIIRDQNQNLIKNEKIIIAR